MRVKKQRICDNCGETEYVYGKSPICLKCQKELKTLGLIIIEKEQILEWGYELVSGPIYNSHGKRVYAIRNKKCNHTYEVVFGNLRTGVNNSKAKGISMPCGVCGPTHRMKTAFEKFMEKNARDYDIQKWDDYRLLVRKLSDITYRQFKEEINPLNYRRGKKTWHLDHIFPIIECFKQGWPVEKAASRENLQMLHWEENLSKSGKVVEES